MDGIELTDVYFNSFSDEFNADLIRLIAEQCKTSVVECGVYRKEHAANLFPYVRRTKIEHKIESLAEDYAEVSASIHRSGGNCYYTELRAGMAVMTIHKVAESKTVVRQAIYRETLARNSQANLFETSIPIPAGALLYSQFKYGVAKNFPQALSFVRVDFPDADGNIVNSINLLAMPMFKNIPQEFIKVVSTEIIEDNLGLNLRSDAKGKKKKRAVGDNEEN